LSNPVSYEDREHDRELLCPNRTHARFFGSFV
jgi:hypothetical protein